MHRSITVVGLVDRIGNDFGVELSGVGLALGGDWGSFGYCVEMTKHVASQVGRGYVLQLLEHCATMWL
eukprot:2673043-Pyramimonas_sp.AAC.1